MNHALSNGAQSAAAVVAYASAQMPAPAPQPTDMQTHVQRAHEVGARLNAVHGSLLDLIGRLYGEGEAIKDQAPRPNPVGLSHEMTAALSTIEAIAERLDFAATRLAQLA